MGSIPRGHRNKQVGTVRQEVQRTIRFQKVGVSGLAWRLNVDEGMNEPRDADGEATGRGKLPILRTPWPQPLVSGLILLRTSLKGALFGTQVGNMQSSRTEAFPTN